MLLPLLALPLLPLLLVSMPYHWRRRCWSRPYADAATLLLYRASDPLH